MADLSPKTQYSLIGRLHDPRDLMAWESFVSIYTPVIERVAAKRGMQPADIDNLVQEVWITVAQNIGEWLERKDRGDFRAWLRRIANNQAVNLLTRRATRPLAQGGSEVERELARVVSREGIESHFEIEYRRRLFVLAAQKVREETAEHTWLAFWLTSIEGVSVEQASRRLNLREANIYFARSRVMARLKKAVRQLEEQGELP
jgi:RNA polymerase sigma-70 factor (ECF subfamily)